MFLEVTVYAIVVYLLGSECSAVIVVSRCATAGDHAAEVSCEVLEAETEKKETEQERRKKKRRRDRGNQGSGEMEGRTSAAAANGMARGRACKIGRRRGGKGGGNKRGMCELHEEKKRPRRPAAAYFEGKNCWNKLLLACEGAALGQYCAATRSKSAYRTTSLSDVLKQHRRLLLLRQGPEHYEHSDAVQG